jgi:hypothetical protein
MPPRLLLPILALLLTGCAASTDAGPGTLAYDKTVFTALLTDHDKIHRTVTELPDGVQAITESDDPAVAARLVDHVTAMKSRLHDDRRVRQWDPLYIAIFDDAEKVNLDITPTGKGVRVRETSTDPAVIALIKQHAGVVSGYAREGFAESARAHEVKEPRR